MLPLLIVTKLVELKALITMLPVDEILPPIILKDPLKKAENPQEPSTTIDELTIIFVNDWLALL